MNDSIAPIIWRGDHLALLDQRQLPGTVVYLEFRDASAIAEAIVDMVVRGAPAIGITAAYAAALSARAHYTKHSPTWRKRLADDLAELRAARPTAVNLAWALDRMATLAERANGDPWPDMIAAAEKLHADDIAANREMGRHGAGLIRPGSGVLTHCNAGALATGGFGTALGVIRSAWAAGSLRNVYATETRPWLQGARLTAWELLADDIDVTLLADGAAAHLMNSGRIDWVITGADRIAANGDTANKIGTYALASLARAHGLGMMVVAPLSTIDLAAPDGRSIPIEERAGEELTALAGAPIAAPGVRAMNPVFDVTPAALIDVIVTEKGLVQRPDAAAIRALFED